MEEIYNKKLSLDKSSVPEFIVPDWGDEVNSGIGLSYRSVRLHQRGFIYTDHKPFGRPCLGVTHSFISSDAMRSHLSPMFASLKKGYLCILQV